MNNICWSLYETIIQRQFRQKLQITLTKSDMCSKFWGTSVRRGAKRDAAIEAKVSQLPVEPCVIAPLNFTSNISPRLIGESSARHVRLATPPSPLSEPSQAQNWYLLWHLHNQIALKFTLFIHSIIDSIYTTKRVLFIKYIDWKQSGHTTLQ